MFIKWSKSDNRRQMRVFFFHSLITVLLKLAQQMLTADTRLVGLNKLF